MPVLATYLFFNGQCAQAMRFYERTLGARMEALMTFADAPPGAGAPPEGAKDLVMHASLKIGDRALMAADAPWNTQQKPMSGFSISLTYDTQEEARRIFDALAQGGSVQMPMGPTFFADAFGSLVDQFGTPWMVLGGMRQM